MNLSSFIYGVVGCFLFQIILKLIAKQMRLNREKGGYLRPMPVALQEKEIEKQVENRIEKDEFDKKTKEEKANHVDKKLDRFKPDSSK